MVAHSLSSPPPPRNATLGIVGAPELEVRTFDVREELSSCFNATAHVLARDPSIALDELVGGAATLSLHDGVGTRTWHGICSGVQLIRAEATGASTYAVSVVPELWRLGLRSGYRIFEAATAPDIVDEVLGDLPHRWEIDEHRQPELLHKVQYGETDLAFVRRILAEAGIAFAFELAGDRMHLVLSDRFHRREPWRRAHAGASSVFDARVAGRFRAGLQTIATYDFQRPDLPLSASARQGSEHEQRCERYTYQQGGWRVKRADPDGSDRYLDEESPTRGRRRAVVIGGGRTGGSREVSFATDAVELTPGSVVAFGGHPHPEVAAGKTWLVTAISVAGARGEAWSLRAHAAPADRPHHPAPVDKPVALGFESATVVGPDGETVHTDDYGRVRVRFPWDRERRDSCWLRPSHASAGAGFGHVAIPRIGEEVLVAFAQGDPEQPILVGRAHNAVSAPAYALPDDRTLSGWQGQSVPDAAGHNAIALEDATGRERLDVHAERDSKSLVRRDRLTTVGGSLHLAVEEDVLDVVQGNRRSHAREVERASKGHVTCHVEGNRTLSVGGSLTRRIERERLQRVAGDAHMRSGSHALNVDRSRHGRVGGADVIEVERNLQARCDGDRHERSSGTYALEATETLTMRATGFVAEGTDITLLGPGGFVRIADGIVTIRGTVIRINEGG